MRIRSLSWKGLALSVVVVAAAAGITLGVTTLLGVTFQGSGSAQQGTGSQQVEGLLMTANRDRLAMCVQVVRSGRDLEAAGGRVAVEAKAKERVEAALVEVAKHPYWQQRGLTAAVASRVVDAGCPSGPPPVDSSYPKPIESISGHRVKEASYYRVFVFVLPAEELERLLGASDWREAPQEMLQVGVDVFAEVTTGLYISPQELGAPAFLEDLLEKGIGLEKGRAGAADE